MLGHPTCLANRWRSSCPKILWWIQFLFFELLPLSLSRKEKTIYNDEVRVKNSSQFFRKRKAFLFYYQIMKVRSASAVLFSPHATTLPLMLLFVKKDVATDLSWKQKWGKVKKKGIRRNASWASVTYACNTCQTERWTNRNWVKAGWPNRNVTVMFNNSTRSLPTTRIYKEAAVSSKPGEWGTPLFLLRAFSPKHGTDLFNSEKGSPWSSSPSSLRTCWNFTFTFGFKRHQKKEKKQQNTCFSRTPFPQYWLGGRN